MKLFFIRYTKLWFMRLRLHLIFAPLLPVLDNLAGLTRLSRWAAKQPRIKYNDFPSKWDYYRRYDLYRHVLEQEGIKEQKINYLEFGVAGGESFKWFMEQNSDPDSRFHGFDTFDGLPEDWGPFKKGAFGTNLKMPEISDSRGQFCKGLFQQTLPPFLKDFNAGARNVIMLDADLYSATLYALASLAPFLKKGDIVFFDEFVVPTHEFGAFHDFARSFYVNLELIAAANNYYFSAFRVA